jgi:S1-C subfamily serine protease
MTDPRRPDDSPTEAGLPRVDDAPTRYDTPSPYAPGGTYTPGGAHTPGGAYTPPPADRPAWTDVSSRAEAPRTPEHWFEPVDSGTQPVERTRTERRGAGLPQILIASLLSAVLAAGGTAALLRSDGTGQAPAAPGATTPVGQPVGSRTVTIDEQSAIVSAAERVSPAIVTITTGNGVDDTTDLPSTGVGSGIIYDASGWILTNRHVVCDSERVSVELRDKRTFQGSVYGIDTLTDLAIVKIDDAADLPTAPIGDSGALKPGQLAIAIGSPLGEFTNSVTTGVVSALGRPVTVNDECGGGDQARTLRNLVQTDAAINPGNSGGALVDSSGQIIGINTAVAGRAQGIGFAIPVNIAKPIMQQAVAGQPLARPWIGVFFADVTPNLVREEGLRIDYGAWIGRGEGNGPAVVEGGPGDRAGLQDGDIITAIDGQRVDLDHPLDVILSQRAPGDAVRLDVLRDGEPLTLTVTLGTRPDDV